MKTAQTRQQIVAPSRPAAVGGAAARRRLRTARVLVVGAGGLGCPASLALAAAGVGTLIVLDPDTVELSNLNRQVMHHTSEIGAAKVESLRTRLTASFPHVTVEVQQRRLTARNLPAFFHRADFIIDGTDGVEGKFLVNDGAVMTGRPYCHGGILGFAGQAMTVLPGRTACYRCLFPEPPREDEIPTCRQAGVIGAVAGIIGAVQAAEAVKFLLGAGELLTDRLLIFDGRSSRCRTVALAPNRRCPLCAEKRLRQHREESAYQLHGS